MAEFCRARGVDSRVFGEETTVTRRIMSSVTKDGMSESDTLSKPSTPRRLKSRCHQSVRVDFYRAMH